MALWRTITLASLRQGGADERLDANGTAAPEDAGQDDDEEAEGRA